jgi:ribosomal protein L37AE/L43A
MKKQTYISSNTNSIICPCCGINELERGAEGTARCTRCGRPVSKQMLETLDAASGRRYDVVSWLRI